MRKHVVGGGPNPETGKNIIVMEDETLPQDFLRIECAYSELDFANTLKTVVATDIGCEVRAVKGFPRHTMHMVVSSADYEMVVALFEDDSVEGFTDAEFAAEIMRATRRNN